MNPAAVKTVWLPLNTPYQLGIAHNQFRQGALVSALRAG
jgi:hypothetical protein